MSAETPPETPPETAALRRRLRWLTMVSALLALAVVGLVTALIARQPARPPEAPAAEMPAPTVRPNDPVGARHPSFDCRAFSGQVGPLPGEPGAPIADLRETAAGEQVRTRGKVMAAYPRIMGRNWLHLCDAPGGDVLVVATTDWAHPGDEVAVEGTLSRDRDIGGVYRFPLLIEGRLEGPGVIEGSVKPEGAIDL